MHAASIDFTLRVLCVYMYELYQYNEFLTVDVNNTAI